MTLSSFQPNIYVPAFAIQVNGRPLDPEVAHHVMQVSVTQKLALPADFSLQIYDPQLQLIDPQLGPFREGSTVQISLGYVGQLNPLFDGTITSLTADFPNSGPPTVQVAGFDRTHDFTRGTASRAFAGQQPDQAPADSEIVTQMASVLGLGATVDATPSRTTPRVQHHTTDFAFMSRLALLNGYYFGIQDGKLHFSKTLQSPNRLTLEWGKTLGSFSPRLSTAGQVNAVKVLGWDFVQKQPIVGRTDRPAGPFASVAEQQIGQGSGGRSEMVVKNARVVSEQEAHELADSILTYLSHVAVTGSGSGVGNPSLVVGTALELKGLGRFDEYAYVATRVTHTIGDGGYQTTFDVNGWDEPADLLGDGRSGGEMVGGDASHGVAVGVVVDNRDPNHLGRVKIKLPGLADDSVQLWARVATLMGGPQRGTWFLPEPEDEVLVAFERGDVSSPYVVGALWNGQDKPPADNANGHNDLRLIKSRSGHLLRFDDSDGAEKVEVIDKTGNNSLTFDASSNTVTVRSAADIVLQAPQGKIGLSAQTIEITSTGDTKVTPGRNLNLEAKANTTLQGTTVNIN